MILSATFRIATRAVIFVVFLGLGAGSAFAQGAWVDDKGALTVDLGYEYVPSSKVIFQPGPAMDADGFPNQQDRPTVNHVFHLGASYVPIDKLELEIDLPLAMVKYTGDTAHEPAGAWDDGKSHTTLTDLRAGVRYQFLEQPLALAGYVAGSLPLSDYEVVGFATGGRHIKMVHLGLSAARTFEPVLPMMYLTGGYEFTMGEHSDLNECTKGVGQLRSDVAAQLGYLLLDGKLDIHAAMNYRAQHEGVEFLDFRVTSMNPVPTACRDTHDGILKESFLFAGGGVGYAITDKISINALARFFIRGYNTRDQILIGLDLSWQIL